MSYFTRMQRPWLSDIESHIRDLKDPIPDMQPFERYNIFGDKLRMLKEYMDSQRPGGIRGLWEDNLWSVFHIASVPCRHTINTKPWGDGEVDSLPGILRYSWHSLPEQVLDDIASTADRTPDSCSASLARMCATVFEGRDTL
jgi:hypothetical protein